MTVAEEEIEKEVVVLLLTIRYRKVRVRVRLLRELPFRAYPVVTTQPKP